VSLKRPPDVDVEIRSGAIVDLPCLDVSNPERRRSPYPDRPEILSISPWIEAEDWHQAQMTWVCRPSQQLSLLHALQRKNPCALQ
jgi:hypothetical protein